MTEIATFAAGCFWGVEQAFREQDGVLEAESGYTNGHTKNPTYKEVCSKTTGHAEAVRVTFDPERISYTDLVALFWKLHDPTQVNRQGPDVGSQYRSAIFTHSDAQAKIAEAAKAAEETSGRHKRPIATIIEPAAEWWRAEDYHQRYFEKNGGGACAINLT